MSIAAILEKSLFSSHSICDIGLLLPKMTAEGREKLDHLCPKATSVVFVLLPYLAEDTGGNISKYARGSDYHVVMAELLAPLCQDFAKLHPENIFVPLCDNSPLPEVYGAHLSGLGLLGKNGLIFDKTYGSYVFIGSIVTDLVLDYGYNPQFCPQCGVCEQACPKGEGACLSALSQKTGSLTASEREALGQSPLIWGCDICAEVCPLNLGAKNSPLAAFRENLIVSLTKAQIEGHSRKSFAAAFPRRAFTWRGPAPLLRNLEDKS